MVSPTAWSITGFVPGSLSRNQGSLGIMTYIIVAHLAVRYGMFTPYGSGGNRTTGARQRQRDQAGQRLLGWRLRPDNEGGQKVVAESNTQGGSISIVQVQNWALRCFEWNSDDARNLH
jgi:hypothetical protein